MPSRGRRSTLAMTSLRLRPTLLAILALLLGAPLAAQRPAAELGGRVSDSLTGAGLPGAIIIVPGTLLETRTDARGDFHLASIPPGAHSIRVLLIGYRPVTRDSVTVQPGETRRLDIIMSRAAIELAPVSVTA
ncbi:MAG TPA: carboxypeptidase-like regulatory domain-containing protein, partial [Gemmatimonadaceae bacterium]|nr:carboxypeptidase-like regulatory domain-containing protein [Gemmatimonadaceae bacterium]